MTQLISNVLMQPKPTDAVEHLTLIEKLEKEKNNWHDDGENNVHRVIDDCIDIVKQHEAEASKKQIRLLQPQKAIVKATWLSSIRTKKQQDENYAVEKQLNLNNKKAHQTVKSKWALLNKELKQYDRLSTNYASH